MRKGWTQTTLGEVAEVIGGGTPSTNVPAYWGNDVVWLTPTEIVAIDGKTVSDSIRKLSHEGLANSGAQILPKGSVILTSRASVGFVAISECELSTNQGFQSLVPKEKVLAYFLMYWIQNNRNEFESRAAGSTFKEISKTNVKSIKLNLPPLPEQKRIVDLISSVDSYIDALEQQVESARKSRSAVLHEMLSAGGDDWTEITLGEVAKVTSGFAFSTRDWTNDGIPVIKINNVRNGKVSLEQCSFVKEPLPRGAEKFILRKGDLLITLTGEIGAIGFVDQEFDLLLNQRVGKIETTGDLTSKSFLGLFLELDNTRKEMWSHGKGNAQLNISPKSIEGLVIALPPLPEQKRIVDLISSMDDGISATERLISETKQLRSGLLPDLLSGEHEIPESYDKVMGAA